MVADGPASRVLHVDQQNGAQPMPVSISLPAEPREAARQVDRSPTLGARPSRTGGVPPATSFSSNHCSVIT
jgi:hypothetical protein